MFFCNYKLNSGCTLVAHICSVGDPSMISIRVGKVWKWSNLVLIRVVVFFIKFDENFVWTKYFFHTYGFLSLEGPLLAGLCSREPGPVSRACSKVKKPYVWKKYFVQTNFLSNLVKKSTTFINTKLLQFHTLPTLTLTHLAPNKGGLGGFQKGAVHLYSSWVA